VHWLDDTQVTSSQCRHRQGADRCDLPAAQQGIRGPDQGRL